MASKKARVLVIDDEKDVRDILSLFLSSEGYDVDAAVNGEHGIEKLNTQNADVVITDINMPGIDGIKTLERIKDVFSDIEVIMITGYGSIESAVECMKKGAFDYISKPFNLEEIKITVQRALEKSELQTLIALYEASKSIFSTVRLDELLKTIIDLTGKVLKADETSIMLFDEQRKLYIAESSGLDSEVIRNTRLALCEGIAGKIAKEKAPVIIGEELNNDPRFSDTESRGDIKSSIVHPIITKGKVFGVLNINRIQIGEPFTENDLKKATIFVSHIAQAIENANLYRELEIKIEELNRAYAELERGQEQIIQSEKLSAIGKLVAGVAHELNNPLTAVMGFSEFLLTCDCSDEIKSHLMKIHSGATRCKKIIQNLISFSRDQKPSKVQTNVNNLLDDVIEISKFDIEKNNIVFRKEIAQNLPTILANPDKIKEVFLCLIRNACYSMSQKPGQRQLIIRTEQTDDFVSIDITDNGIGISSVNLKRIFDPFFTTKDVGKGVGLGLSTSYGIVKNHGGEIAVESDEGSGATFTVKLPFKKEPPAFEKEFVVIEKKKISQGKRVLVVDDEEFILDLCKSVLEKSGYQVTTIPDGKAAIKEIENNSYDVILLDIRMPGLNGQDVYSYVKNKNPQLAGRIIFSTGDIVSEETRNLLEETGNPHIDKPFNMDDLIRIVQDTEKSLSTSDTV